MEGRYAPLSHLATDGIVFDTFAEVVNSGPRGESSGKGAMTPNLALEQPVHQRRSAGLSLASGFHISVSLHFPNVLHQTVEQRKRLTKRSLRFN